MAEEKRPKVGSAAVVVDGKGRILLGKRNKVNYRGKWVLPGGGVNWGETLENAVKREISEETGLSVDVVRFLCFREIINLPGDYHTLVFFHLCKPVGDGKVSPKDDLSEAGFFSCGEIKGLDCAESVRSVLEEAGIWGSNQ
ncbi:MAG: NUDIX hydrolase [archaeon]